MISTVVRRARFLTILSAVNGALSLAAGISYHAVSPTELPVALLTTLGTLGFCALVGTGLWVAAYPRRAPLIVLTVVAAGFAAASGLGFAGAQVAHSARLEPTGLPAALHAAGLVAATLLLIAALAELAGMESRVAPSPR